MHLGVPLLRLAQLAGSHAGARDGGAAASRSGRRPAQPGVDPGTAPFARGRDQAKKVLRKCGVFQTARGTDGADDGGITFCLPDAGRMGA